MDGRKTAGECGERIAAEYLRLLDYRILEINARCGPLEIDIVAADRGCLVFAEVKTRRSASFGPASSAVDRRKMSNMRRAARIYLARPAGGGFYSEIRFDVIAIDIDPRRGGMTLRHMRGVA